jgi:hypothetical protein
MVTNEEKKALITSQFVKIKVLTNDERQMDDDFKPQSLALSWKLISYEGR